MRKRISIFTIILIILVIVSLSQFGISFSQANSFDYGGCINKYANAYVGALTDTIGYMMEICPQERENLYQSELIFGSITLVLFLMTLLSWKFDNLKKQSN